MCRATHSTSQQQWKESFHWPDWLFQSDFWANTGSDLWCHDHRWKLTLKKGRKSRLTVRGDKTTIYQSEDFMLTGIWVIQPKQEWHQSGFSRPAGSYHSHNGTSWHLKTEVMEDRSIFAGRVGKADIMKLQLTLQLFWTKHQTLCQDSEEQELLSQTCYLLCIIQKSTRTHAKISK